MSLTHVISCLPTSFSLCSYLPLGSLLEFVSWHVAGTGWWMVEISDWCQTFCRLCVSFASLLILEIFLYGDTWRPVRWGNQLQVDNLIPTFEPISMKLWWTDPVARGTTTTLSYIDDHLHLRHGRAHEDLIDTPCLLQFWMFLPPLRYFNAARWLCSWWTCQISWSLCPGQQHPARESNRQMMRSNAGWSTRFTCMTHGLRLRRWNNWWPRQSRLRLWTGAITPLPSADDEYAVSQISSERLFIE